MEDVALTIDNLEAKLFEFEPGKTETHDMLETYSQWNDYAYKSAEKYGIITAVL